MALITLDITIGRGEKAVTTRHVFDPDDMPLIFMESAEEGKIGPMRESIAELLDLTEQQSRQLTLRHLKQISTAIKEASASPNGS